MLQVDPGAVVTIEAVTHHAGDAPDLLMDAGIETIWASIPESERGPGVHIMTGPIEVRGAKPGDTLRVEIMAMKPRLPYGSNCAANWGLLYNQFGKERITIYALDDEALADTDRGFCSTARPLFGFDFRAMARYEVPGVVTPPEPSSRESPSAIVLGCTSPG